MLTRFRPIYEKYSILFGKASLNIGLPPDFWTLFSLVSSAIACILLADNQFWGGFLMIVVMNVMDMMDGATARAGKIGTPFGTVLDHTCDRYAEFFIIGGLILGGAIYPTVGLFTASGIVMASYVRAKAESAGGLKNCVVGLAGRQEKLILLWIGLILFALGFSTWGQLFIVLTGVVSHITAIQRLFYARKIILHPDKE